MTVTPQVEVAPSQRSKQEVGRDPSICFTCLDQPHILHTVTNYVSNVRQASFSDFRQDPVREGKQTSIYCRASWFKNGSDGLQEEEDPEEVQRELLDVLEQKFGALVRADLGTAQKKLGLLCSETEHCVRAVLAKIQSGDLDANLVYVLSNFKHGELKHVVEAAGAEYIFEPMLSKKPPGARVMAHDDKYTEIMKSFGTDVIGLGRFMRVLTPKMLKDINQPVINEHHGFSPLHPGKSPHHDAYVAGMQYTAGTALYATEDLDDGPVIWQTAVEVPENLGEDGFRELGVQCEETSFCMGLKKHVGNKVIRNRVYPNRRTYKFP